METKKKTRKIYRFENQLVDRCRWCNGVGYDTYLAQTCYVCKGTGGKRERVRVLVGEEVVIEGGD